MDDPATIGPVDLAAVWRETVDTKSVAQAKTAGRVGNSSCSAQNGVQKDDMLREVPGDKAIIGGVSWHRDIDRCAGRHLPRRRPDGKGSVWGGDGIVSRRAG